MRTYSSNLSNENQISRLRRNLFLYLRYWKYFLISMIVFLLLAHLYLKYTTPQFISSVKLLVHNENGGSQLTEEAIFNDLGFDPGTQNTENELEILKSSYLMADVVKKLGLQYVTLKKGYVRNVDLYNDGPVQVLNWSPVATPSKSVSFEIYSPRGSSEYEIKYQQKKIKAQFGSPLRLPEGNLTLVRKMDFTENEIKDIVFQIHDVESMASSLASRVSASTVGKRSTILQVSITDIHPQRSKEVLNELMSAYDVSQINDKNRILKNTLTFLDERIDLLTGEVKEVDGDVQRFKSSNKITDLSSEGNLIMQEANTYSKTLTEITVQEEILNNISANLSRNSNDFEFVPTNSGLTNLTLNQLLESFNQLLLEREKIRTNLGASHPNNAIVAQQLANLRLNIMENISSIRNDIKINKNILQSKESALTGKLSSLPLRERQLIEIQRQQNIKQNLYNYLLQKREETALRLAVTVSNSRIVEPAKIGKKFKPKPNYIWILAIFSGFLIPLLAVRIFLFFVDTIRSEEDLFPLTNVPIIGSIALSKNKNTVVVHDNNRSPIAEMFRLIRANFQFIGQGTNNKTILLTSSTSGEGKSFISINFGLTLALAGKKVCLIELDMRKPKFLNYLGLKQPESKGITEYLIKDTIDWQSVVSPTDLHPYLSCALCGIIPPNPSELLLSDKLVQLIEKLKEHFDYIIIDTPPVGMVSDALLLTKLADTTFYIVRQEKTLKSQLRIINELSEQSKLPRPYIIFNGIKYNKRGYRYGYGYGYGYGYYDESMTKN
ncbi:MAG: polysaccharide biosynthesis tyrosine autokinase [Bacteroidetes bacterium]|nr:polysaccharide biosynthesis tyrosine autokinase [Bacteroidota bacterium]